MTFIKINDSPDYGSVRYVCAENISSIYTQDDITIILMRSGESYIAGNMKTAEILARSISNATLGKVIHVE